MGIKDRRRNIRHGKYSRALIIPASLEKGRMSTLAANRIMLVDPRGRIAEDDLLKFLEEQVEPRFWAWFKKIESEKIDNAPK